MKTGSGTSVTADALRQRSDAAIGEPRSPMWRAIDASYGAACSYAVSGEPEAALEALEECLEAGDRDVERWRLDPDLDSLRSDERFQHLLRQMSDPAEGAIG